ncbi:MAG: hypothetical protein AB1644_11730 [Candidatus Zixiibacteriota bacterium]
MKTKLTTILSLILLTLVGYSSAFATASTHIWAPSTDVQPYKLVHVTCDMYLPAEHDAFGNTLPAVTNIGLTMGILPFTKFNMEIGFDHKSGLGLLDAYPLYGNAKVGIPENAFGNISPALAVGVYDVGTKSDMTDYNVFYAKVAKSFTANGTSLGRFSVGYFSGNDKLLLDQNGEKDNSGLLAAWERTMTELSDKLWVCCEYMGTNSAYGTFNVGASWKFAPNVAVIGAYDLFNNSDLASTFTMQVDIDI